MIVLDTNVLSYAVGREHPLREPCRRIVEAIGRGTIDATTTVGVVEEFLHVRSRGVGREDALEAAERFVSLLSPLLVVEEDDLRSGLRLFERHHNLDAFDAVLAGTAIRVDAEAVISADKAFDGIPRLRCYDPSGPEIDSLIGKA